MSYTNVTRLVATVMLLVAIALGTVSKNADLLKYEDYMLQWTASVLDKASHNIEKWRWHLDNITLHKRTLRKEMKYGRESNESIDLPPVCTLQGKVEDCNCDYFQVERLNTEIIRPRLSDIVQRRFFRFFKVDLHCTCPFWPEDGMCNMPACSVCECEDQDVPEPAKSKDLLECQRPLPEMKESAVDRTVDTGVGKKDMRWTASNNPWIVSDAQSLKESQSDRESDFVYVDLLLNPERYTGYKGEHAHRIWNAIYSESCFEGLGESLFEEKNSNVCKEKHIFYKLVSGIHSSITAHIVGEYPKEECTYSLPDIFNGIPGGMECQLDERYWGPNLKLFYQRLGSPKVKSRIENLYFVYLFTLQATVKAAPYLLSAKYSTGNEDEDAVTATLVKDLLLNPRMNTLCHNAFDEGLLWKGSNGEALKSELQMHFQNITSVMNCVGCEKCKLWGKLQLLGLGTALKILFSVDHISELILTRNEVIALFNLLSRLSDSLDTVSVFGCTLRGMGYNDATVTNHCSNSKLHLANHFM